MAAQVQKPSAASINGSIPRKPSTPRAPVKKPAASTTRSATNNASRPTQQKAAPVSNKAYSVAGDNPGNGVGSAYAIMAQRIASRVADLAENITFSERPKPQERVAEAEEKRRPRKLEMRFQTGSSQEHVSFSAPFLDNTLQKMLQLQNRMLTTTAELSKSAGVDEKVIKEHASQSAELSRIIAMICAEKARQGA